MLYVNFDLETTGGLPDIHAILNLGAVAHESETWKEISSFDMNLAIPDHRSWDADTKKWWLEDPEAGPEKLAKVTANPWSAKHATQSFFAWLQELPEMTKIEDTRVAFVANPIAYDMPFLRSYMKDYRPESWEKWSADNKAGLGGIDLPTLAMTVMGADTRQPTPAYPDARRRLWPDRWNPKHLPHAHLALDDARHQAYAFVQIMKELDEIRGRRPY